MSRWNDDTDAYMERKRDSYAESFPYARRCACGHIPCPAPKGTINACPKAKDSDFK
jgi:hypothetical protein